jgi:hypothetical protein
MCSCPETQSPGQFVDLILGCLLVPSLWLIWSQNFSTSFLLVMVGGKFSPALGKVTDSITINPHVNGAFDPVLTTCILQAAWLLRLCGVSAHSPKEFDDPNTTISNLLSGLKSLGFAPPSYPPIKLAVGYGPEVCAMLDALAGLALQTKGWTPQPLLHIQTRYVCGTPMINIICAGQA